MTAMAATVEWVDLDAIDIKPGRRAVDPARVDALVESIRAIGLQTPPTVRAIREGDNWRYDLVAGAHRLAALKRLGLDAAHLAVVDTDDVNAELWEIDENLCRAELSPSERAELTARRKRIYETLHPETKHGTNQHTRSSQVGNSSQSQSFARETARVTGRSHTSVARDAERGAKVCDGAHRVIHGTKLDTGVFLDKLAKLPFGDDQVIYARHELDRLFRQEAKDADATEADRRNRNADKAVKTTRCADLARRLCELLDADEAEGIASEMRGLSGDAIADAILRELRA